MLGAIDAKERGAEIASRTRFVSARRGADVWQSVLEDANSGKTREIRARALVNAAGPWVAEVCGSRLGVNSSKKVRLIKGSHLVTRRLYEGGHAYILQNPDKRIVFTIPYQNDFTLIGTTDVPYEGEPHDVRISEDEIRYLRESVARPLRTLRCGRGHCLDLRWCSSSIRRWFDHCARSSRAIMSSISTRPMARPLPFPFLEARSRPFAVSPSTPSTRFRAFFRSSSRHGPRARPCPGGDFPNGDFDGFLADLKARKPFLDATTAHRLARAYGTRVDALLGEAHSRADLGRDFGAGLSEAEIDYLMRAEWARTVEDILWRRSKLGLHLTQAAVEDVGRYLEARQGSRRRHAEER